MIFFKKNKFLTFILILLTVFVYYNFTREVHLENNSDPKSEFYVNSLYSSNMRIYYDFLSDNEKKMYKIMFNDIKNHKVKRKLSYDEFECEGLNDCAEYPLRIFEVFETEYPELFSFATFMIIDKGDSFEITYIYATPLKSFDTLGEMKIKRIVNDIREKTKNMTDEEKVLYVYNFIGNNYTYDRIFMYTAKNQSAFNAIINKNAVCAGFSKVSSIIFQNIGIESYSVEGTSTGPHMWNIIKLKDKYYYFDSTVAACIDPKYDEYYDGLNQTYMNSYVLKNPVWFPKVETEPYTKLENGKLIFID